MSITEIAEFLRSIKTDYKKTQELKDGIQIVIGTNDGHEWDVGTPEKIVEKEEVSSFPFIMTTYYNYVVSKVFPNTNCHKEAAGIVKELRSQVAARGI